jgi:hypothetical protein
LYSAMGVRVILHIHLKVGSVIYGLDGRLESRSCPPVSERHFLGGTVPTLTVFDTSWCQGRPITQDDAFKQESIAREMVLRSEIYFIRALFQRLKIPKMNRWGESGAWKHGRGVFEEVGN